MTHGPRDIEISLLGVVTVSVYGTEIPLSPVERQLVALLAAASSGGLDADRLADQLWPDRLPNTWKASLRNSISRLNRKVEGAHPGAGRLISDRVTNRQLQVDDDAVDLWRLQVWASDPSQVDAAGVGADPRLLRGAPFPNCELSPLLHRTIDAVRAERQDIIDAWAKQGEQLSHQLLAELRSLCLDDPYNEPLAESVAELHITIEQWDIAAEFLTDLQTEAPLSDALAELLNSLQQRQQPVAIGSSAPRATFPLHSPRIANLAARSFFGRDEPLADLLAAADQRQRGVLIHGESGIGKTRLAAEAAARLGEAGYHTGYVVADEHTFGSLQPFLDAFPELGDEVRPYLAQLDDPNVQAHCRQKILGYLATAYAGHPLCLVVDDLQWLDDQSSALLMSLCRAPLEAGRFVIGVGRTGERSARWAGWLSELSRADMYQLKVGPLDQAAVLDTIVSRYGDIENLAAAALASQLLELSSGIPEVAHWLLDHVDQATLQIRTGEAEATGYATVVGALGPELQRYGAVGSIIGRQFNTEDINSLGGFTRGQTETHIQGLQANGLVVELPIPGEYRFAHVLVAAAFRKVLGQHEQVSLHAAAFNGSMDPFRRAWHAEAAAPVIGEAAAAEALLIAARLHSSEGNSRATIMETQRAIRLDRASVEPGDHVRYIEALEHTGQRANSERLAVVKEAIAADDMSTALDAAAAALPETEAFEGDPARVKVLQMIEPDHLSVDEQIRFHVQLTRQLLLVGRIDEAVQQAALAEDCAVTPDQKATAWLSRHLAAGLGRPTWLEDHWPSTTEIESEELRLDLSQYELVSAIAAGQSKLRYETLVDHAEAVPPDRFPLLHWFSQLFLATALTDQGRHDEASQIAERAHQFGLQAGIRVAAGTYQTQLFMWQLHHDCHGALYPLFAGRGPDDIAANVIFDAGLAACHLAHASDDQQRREALASIAPICNRAMKSHFDIAVIGLLAHAIPTTQNQRLVEWANERLATRTGGFALLASAAGNLGPCSGLMAKLETEPRRATELREQAIDESDQYELALWQVTSRLDLATAVGSTDARSSDLISEARELASTPWLERLWSLRRPEPR